MGSKFLITFLAVASVTSAQYSSDYQPVPSKVLQVPEYIAAREAPELPLTLQVPKEEAPAPFNTYVPEAFANSEDDNTEFDVAVPSRDLQVPVGQWNPDNDPALFYEPAIFYELPVEITKKVQPTNLHPKKYSKQVFDKVKPIASKPKEEVLLVPVKLEDLLDKKRQEDKTAENFAKTLNQRQLEKVKGVEAGDPAAAATDALSFGSSFHQGTNTQPLHSGQQRVEFQMHGHQGPKSYKWGYDTGKGHNRQFRYEERDKDGYVKGHYGYFDKHGVLQLVHYDSHPHEGFHAEGNFGKY